MIGNFWKMRTGQTRGGQANEGGWGRMGGGWADGQTARRIEANRRTIGRADKSGRGADRANEWQSERTGRGQSQRMAE